MTTAGLELADVEAVRRRLVRQGHVGPVVAVSTAGGRLVAGDPDERFEIGSVTKLFTALLLAALAQDGTVRLDDPVIGLLTARPPLPDALAAITLEQLASHRSGLPRLPPGVGKRSFSRTSMADPYADQSIDAVLDGLRRVRLRGTPGETGVRYSNLGVGLLGTALGEATGAGYEQSVLTRVVTPLGLASTDCTDTPLHQGRYRRRPVGPWHLAALAGAGGLRSSAADLLRFLEQVRDGTGPLADAIAETRRPRASGRPGVGLGWFLLGDGALLLHNGGTLGARSEVRVEPHSRRCIVVLGDGRRGTAPAAQGLLAPT